MNDGLGLENDGMEGCEMNGNDDATGDVTASVAEMPAMRKSIELDFVWVFVVGRRVVVGVVVFGRLLSVCQSGSPITFLRVAGVSLSLMSLSGVALLATWVRLVRVASLAVGVERLDT